MDLEVEKEGLGYSALIPALGIGLRVDYLVEHSGELSGELEVSQAPKGHLMRGKFNLSAPNTRKTTANLLDGLSQIQKGKDGVTWFGILEKFCFGVLELERAGAGVIKVGQRKPREATSFVLDPFILGGNKPTVLYGMGGGGKSTLAAAAAVAVHTGISTFAGWTVPARANVMILDWEAESDDWNDAISGISAGIGIEPPEMDYIACDRPLTSMLHQVAREVRTRDIGLIIVDSVGHALPNGREGASYEEGAMRLFKALRQIGVPSLLIDHIGKGEDAGKQGPYGSIYKWNSVRHAWELKAGEDDSTHLAVIHRKHNNTPKLKPWGMEMARNDGTILFVREDVANDPKLNTANTIADRIALVLRTGSMTIKDIGEELDDVNIKTIAVTLNRSDRFVKVGQEGKAQIWGMAAAPNLTPVPDHYTGGAFDSLIDANEARGQLKVMPDES